jgi:molecular chaperone Hsp33
MDEEPDIEVRTYFARGKNALVARGDFSELFAAWYLHCMDHGLQVDGASADVAKDALAAITLHCAGRPWKESCAWTVKFPDPRINVFAAGDNNSGTVVAHVPNEAPEQIAKGVFYADVIEPPRPARRSVVDFEPVPFFRAVEYFYERSEQRPVRLFCHGEEDFVMVSAQPDCDLGWLAGLDDEAIRRLDRDVDLSLLEKRSFNFQCGCNHARMLEFMLPVFRSQGDGLFLGDPSVTVVCPRCGARHIITREALEAMAAGGS